MALLCVCGGGGGIVSVLSVVWLVCVLCYELVCVRMLGRSEDEREGLKR